MLPLGVRRLGEILVESRSYLAKRSGMSHSTTVDNDEAECDDPAVVPVFLVPFEMFFLVLPGRTVGRPICQNDEGTNTNANVSTLRVLCRVSSSERLGVQ